MAPLPTFEEMRRNAFGLLGDAEDELRSDWQTGQGAPHEISVRPCRRRVPPSSRRRTRLTVRLTEGAVKPPVWPRSLIRGGAVVLVLAAVTHASGTRVGVQFTIDEDDLPTFFRGDGALHPWPDTPGAL